MKLDVSQAFARLRGSLYSTSQRDRNGTCRVLQKDLELLLAEVEQLSNAQMARYLIRIVLEELQYGDEEPTRKTSRAAERRVRQRAVIRGLDRSADPGGVDQVAGPFVFGDEPALLE